MKKEIIIEVEGGLVQNVFSDDETIEVEILDRDDMGCREITQEEEELENKIKYMKEIY